MTPVSILVKAKRKPHLPNFVQHHPDFGGQGVL